MRYVTKETVVAFSLGVLALMLYTRYAAGRVALTDKG